MNERIDTVTLWRPVGELELIQKAGMRAFPPRLADQPIFYPVTSEAYATQIARDWNVPASRSGFVTRFEVRRSFLDRYSVQHAGSRAHLKTCRPSTMQSLAKSSLSLSSLVYPFLRTAAAEEKRSRNALPLPGRVRWRARPKASASSGTLSVMTLPEAM